MTPRKPIDAYSEGFSAQAWGLPLSANPYPAGLDRYCAWRDGWKAKHDQWALEP